MKTTFTFILFFFSSMLYAEHLNINNTPTILDVIKLINVITGNSAETGDLDCDGDNAVNTLDIICLINTFVNLPTQENQLTRFVNSKQMENYIKAGMRDLTPVAIDFSPFPVPPVSIPSTSGTEAPQVSQTNIQEVGVDEADRSKTDGTYWYYLTQANLNTLQVANLSSSEIPEIPEMSEITKTHSLLTIKDISGGTTHTPQLATLVLKENFKQLYLHQKNSTKTLLAIATNNNYAIKPAWFSSWSWRQGKTHVNFINVDNPTAPEIKHQLTLDGNLISSRRIEDYLYLVTRHTPYVPEYHINFNEVSALDNEEILADISIDDLLPTINIDDTSPIVPNQPCFKTLYDRYSMDIISIYVVDINHPKQVISECIIGASETLYVSKNALYLATTRYDYRQNIPVPVDVSGLPINVIDLVFYPPEITTDIHKFSFSAQNIEYKGSGTAPGHLGWHQDKKSFRMGEHEGVLSVATSMGDTGNESASTHLSLFQEKKGLLEKISTLPNENRHQAIGKPGERLYAARFVGDRAYLVTFRLTDPLYIVDLADKKDPKIIARLEMPGYADYLHPLPDDLLLGVGKFAVSDTFGDGNRGAWYQGVMLSLIDTSDAENPFLIQQHIIGNRGSEAAVLYDHRAIAVLSSHSNTQLALPIKMNNRKPTHSFPAQLNPEETPPWQHYNWTHSGLYTFNINRSVGIQAHQKIIVAAHNILTLLPVSREVITDRTILSSDFIHYLHEGSTFTKLWNNQ